MTGATGFLGAHAARALLARGHRVIGTHIESPHRIERVETVTLDVSDPGPVRRLLRDLRPDAIVHTAAMTDVAACAREPEAARRVNAEGTKHIVDAACEFVPSAPFLYTSTDLVFDGAAAPYAEAAGTNPLTDYARQKLAGEAAALAHPTGTVLRVALLFGAGVFGRAGFLGWMRGTLARGERLRLFRDEFRTPVAARDVAEALAALCESPLPGLFHAGGPERLSRLEMGRLLCRAEGHREELLEPCALAEVPLPTPRPPDVSLESSKLVAAIGWHRTRFMDFLQEGRGRLPLPH
ncbi:MAG: SDR family oxidoreductase [Candidatus Sumerlaeia bacterium]|nr:SDR family oxidoreductase [Candidatus Sumerlaeia bacterium]